MTELIIGDGGAKLYLAAILDLFSRFIVGWAVSAVNDRHLAIKALDAPITPAGIAKTVRTRIGSRAA